VNIRKILHGSAALAAILAATTLAPVSVPAQTDETERVKAQAELERARADRDRAAADRISALNLPNFEGNATLNQGAGAVEATMLTSRAVDRAAAMIVDRLPAAGTFIVLAGDETLDFGRIGAIDAELNAINVVFEQLETTVPHERQPQLDRRLRALPPVSAVIAAATAAAGLLRADTEVTAIDLPAISNRLFAAAVAGRLGTRAILPSAAIGTVEDDATGGAEWANMSLLQKLNGLVERRRRMQAERDTIPVPNPKDPPVRHTELTAAIARFDAFSARVTTADAAGAVPIVQAVRLQSLLRRNPQVLRVYVDRAGGNLISRTNILTTLGFKDPVRVSGGMLASYVLTDPSTGSVAGGDMISCRTVHARLRSVQRGVWRSYGAEEAETAVCTSGRSPASQSAARRHGGGERPTRR
jgi:hypothetical protein